MDAILIECQGQDLNMLTSSPDVIGPGNYKPKGTWTRINKMNFGLGGFTKAIMLPGLGKRDSREAHEGRLKSKILRREN